MEELLNLSIDPQTLRVSNRESERREFKSQFENGSLWKYAKTMAAFANRDGGVIFFGVKNKPRELLGINENHSPDELVFSNFVKEHFEPDIPFSFDTRAYSGRTLLYVTVPPALNKPVICKKKKVQQFREPGKKDKELLREGAIYYRYSSASEEIKYAELYTILENRVQKVFHSMVDNITLMNKVGYDRAAIVDAADLSGNDKTTSVYITTDTAKNINWIQKGRFSETDEQAEKAYYVTREIEIKHGVEVEKPVDPGQTHTLTKTALMKETALNINHVDAVLWKCGLLNNPAFHLSGNHGKSKWHKFTESAKEKILTAYPKDMEGRKAKVKEIVDEYNESIRN